MTAMVSKGREEVSAPESIGCKKRTRGTETSQYLEERTSTETPSVAASERGPGQWFKRRQAERVGKRGEMGDSPVGVMVFWILE